MTDKKHSLILQKRSILEVRLCSKYTLSIELFLDRFCQWNKFQKKSKKKFRDIQQMTPYRPKDMFWRSFRGQPENILGKFRINLPGTSLWRQIETSPGRHFGTYPGRQIGASLRPRSELPQCDQIVSLGNVLRTLEGDVLGSPWGPIFAGWGYLVLDNGSFYIIYFFDQSNTWHLRYQLFYYFFNSELLLLCLLQFFLIKRSDNFFIIVAVF